jgi:heme a synthase
VTAALLEEKKAARQLPVAVLLYTVAVIIWGAYVRATGSGAGCGEHWPLCNGMVLPREARLQTLIEFTHRITSGLSLVGVLIMAHWAFKKVPPGHLLRKAAIFSVVFIITEALIGAGLVLLGLVASNQSVGRAVSLALHLANTFVLVAWLSAAVIWSSPRWHWPRVEFASGKGRLLALVALGGVLIVGVSGAVAALGDTLFPAESGSSLGTHLASNFSAASHFLIRLRILHPVFAVSTALYLLVYAQLIKGDAKGDGSRDPVQVWSLILSVGVLTQLAVGFANLALLAPVWIQLVHLALANAVWISLVILILHSSTKERLI